MFDMKGKLIEGEKLSELKKLRFLGIGMKEVLWCNEMI